MSAFATLVRPDRAFLWTDGAVTDVNAVLLAVERKTSVVERHPVVVTGRGPAIMPKLLAAYLTVQRVSPTDIEEHGDEITGGFFAKHAGLIGSVAAVDVCIVAWSSVKAGPIVALRTTEPEEDGKFYKLGTEFCAPAASAAEAKRLRLRLGRITVSQVEPERYGRELMEAQRRTPGAPHLGFEGLYVVGGHIMQTEVSASGVMQRIIHRWTEDQVGHRIRPVQRIQDHGSAIIRAGGTAHPVLALRPIHAPSH